MAWWWRLLDCVVFLIEVCFITRFCLFVWLGCFYSPHLSWSASPSQSICITGGLGDLRCSYLPLLERLIGTSWVSLLLVEVLFAGRFIWRPWPLGSIRLDLDRVFLSPSLSYCCFRCGVPYWRISGVPCFSRTFFCWNFSGEFALLSIIWRDA